MNQIEVFDPPMCCSTGVCGPSVDPALARFSSDLHWLANQKIAIERYNLAQQPQVFAASELVKTALKQYGNECLPLILLNGVVTSKACYPSDHLATRFALIPWKAEAPVGPDRLRQLAGGSLSFHEALKG